MQKTVVYYRCSSENYKSIVGEELKAIEAIALLLFEFSFNSQIA